MGIKIDPEKCTGCMACELACGYHRDDAFALLSACVVVYRPKDLKDYFGAIIKEEDSLVIARPEGLEIKKIGGTDEGQEEEGDASAKPMLLREACDLCSDQDEGPLCIRVCPANAVYQD
ncbi:MAG: 4Fe-4S binding protein [Deltaproteobacteria bacterium]|nr:4Fe-4S binding protein [Deltaproteobacteria bacterium]